MKILTMMDYVDAVEEEHVEGMEMPMNMGRVPMDTWRMPMKT